EGMREKALASGNENSLHFFASTGDPKCLAAWQKIQRQKTTERPAARLRVMEGGLTPSRLNMRTDTDTERFQKAIADTYAEAHKAGNIGVICAMADRGFSLAKLALPTIFHQASAQKNVTQLKTFVRCGGLTP